MAELEVHDQNNYAIDYELVESLVVLNHLP